MLVAQALRLSSSATTMHKLEPTPISPEFLHIWQDARAHIEHQADGAIRSWFCSYPRLPMLEHLSFRLGNQVFVVRIVDADGRVEVPGTLEGMRLAARGLRGHACLMPMQQDPGAGSWTPVFLGWGLVCVRTGTPIDPVALVTDEPVVIGDWELQHFAAYATVDALQRHGMQVDNWQFNPQVHPTLWFTRPGCGQEWVVVRAARHPHRPRPPRNWKALVRSLSVRPARGHFLPVVVSADDPARLPGQRAVEEMRAVEGPLLRGHPLQAFFLTGQVPPWHSSPGSNGEAVPR